MQCDPNCATSCTDVGTCPNGSCNAQFVSAAVPSSSPTLYTCAACAANCAGNCSSPGTCDGPCAPEYFFDAIVTKTCIACSRNCTGGCANSGAGFCDCPCASGFTCWPAVGYPTKNACYPCASGCTVCNTAGPGACNV
jgi:hypothetical protein